MCARNRQEETDRQEKIVSSSAPLLETGNQVRAEEENAEELTEYNAKFTNYDPNEEATCIRSLTYLREQPIMCYFVVPILTICSAFIFGLFLFWYPGLRAKFFYTKVKDIEEATHIMVDGRQTKDVVVSKLFRSDLSVRQLFPGDLNHHAKDTFVFRFIKFQFDYETRCFNPVRFDAKMTYAQILNQHSNGISESDVEQARHKYGRCQLEVPMKSIPRLLVDEVLNPFYLFQVFSMILWFCDGYEKYAACILVVSLLGVFESLFETVHNIKNIRKMAKYECKVEVLRWPNTRTRAAAAEQRTISSEEIVPGDLIVVPESCVMPCDAIVLSGTCIVNESMLTGESVPVIKNGIQAENKLYDPQDFESSKKVTVFSGTKVIQTKKKIHNEQVLALVTRTGFLTTKGSLVRDILYPRDTNFKFYRDSLIFVGFMALVAIIGFISIVPTLISMGTKTPVLIDKSLDLITITVPPALPATMSAGVAFAVSRLKKKQIFCISPPRVNVSGRIQIMVFDKTGTLTEDGLQIIGVRGLRNQGSESNVIVSQKENWFSEFHPSIKNLLPKDTKASASLDKSVLMNESMASCHAITLVNDELIGDPLEIKMFEQTDWVLDEQAVQENESSSLASVRPKSESRSSNKNIEIIQRFDFESKLQRMSVIVRNQNDNQFRLHLKGSPEKVHELCIPQTIPKDFEEILNVYTVKGYRVIALASKLIQETEVVANQLKTLPRDHFENNLTFLGIIVMENKLKEQTRPTITILNDCNIRTIMATGDNTLTAISVGHSCNILQDGQTVFFGDVDDKNQIIWKNSKILAQELDDDADFDSLRQSSVSEKEMFFNVEDQTRDVPWDGQASKNFGVALNGKLLSFLSQNKETYRIALRKILFKAQVYARMSPDDKANLIELLQETMKVQVGMCGDGANDCGALKQADAGISLSEAEASIAAPFTSKIQDISCVINLLREGRAALTTTFQAFKFIELYSIIQFYTVSMLYLKGSNLSDNQFLYIDIGVLVPLCIFQSWTGAWYKLTKHLPQESLFSWPVLVSVLGSAAIQFVFQFWTFYETQLQLTEKDYVPCKQSATVIDDDPPCSDNTALYLVSCQQYLTCCLTFSIAKPFRKPIWRNPLFFVSAFAMFGYQTYLFFYMDSWSRSTFGLLDIPSHFRWYLFWLFVLNTVATYLYEKLFIGWFSRAHQARQQKLKEREFEKEMAIDQDGDGRWQEDAGPREKEAAFEGGLPESASFTIHRQEHFESGPMTARYWEDSELDADGWKKALERYEERTVK